MGRFSSIFCLERKVWLRFVVVAVFLLAVVVRVYFVWLNRFCIKPDFGVVALMAKHMAEGKAFPLLFYGHAYAGTLEPMTGALLFRLLGTSEFVMSLGTAFCAFLCLPVVYRWGRDLGGVGAGVAGLCFCVVGSLHLAVYSTISVGDYALTLFFSPLILWLTCDCVLKELRGQKVSLVAYLLLGVAGGLAWWTFQLSLSVLITAAVLFLVLGVRLFRWRILGGGMGGFLVGSAPFWIWNLQHDWATFRLARAFRGGFQRRLQSVFLSHLPNVMGWQDRPSWAKWLSLLILATALGIVVYDAVRRRGKNPTMARLSVSAVLLLAVVHISFLCASKFGDLGTARYLLPLLPPLAVILGAATARRQRASVVAAWLLLGFLIYPQKDVFPRMREISETYREDQASARERGLSSVYAKYDAHGLNFASREQVTVCDPRGAIYEPYGIVNELTDRITVLNNTGSISNFLAYAGGGARVFEGRGRFRMLHYDFDPPSALLTEVPSSEVTSVRGSDGTDLTRTLTDADIETSWAETVLRKEVVSLTIELSAPIEVAAVQVLSEVPGCYPSGWLLEGRAAAGQDWVPITGCAVPTAFFWSGQRVYWGGMGHRLEARFPARKLVALRLRCLGRRHAWLLNVAEIQVFAGASPNDEFSSAGMPELLSLLESRGICRVYADRWESNVLHQQKRVPLMTLREVDLFGNDAAILPA